MTVTEPLSPSSIEAAVLATVAYSDVFDMPLERDRIRRFLIGKRAESVQVAEALDRLVSEGLLDMRGDLAFLPGREEVVGIHAERVTRAVEMWDEAERWGARIGRLPFVRAVAVTGGLACDSVADHDDIDYLIVTEPGRLWIARLFSVVLVHAGRLRHVDLCPNYLVADDAMVLDERTSYSARELAQMVDVIGTDVLTEMRRQNDWLLEHLPNASIVGDTHRVRTVHRGPLSTLCEWVLRRSAFDRFEHWEMTRKVKRLQDVSSRRVEVGRPDESSFSPSVCKGHMVGNAAGIEVAWRERLVAVQGFDSRE